MKPENEKELSTPLAEGSAAPHSSASDASSSPAGAPRTRRRIPRGEKIVPNHPAATQPRNDGNGYSHRPVQRYDGQQDRPAYERRYQPFNHQPDADHRGSDYQRPRRSYQSGYRQNNGDYYQERSTRSSYPRQDNPYNERFERPEYSGRYPQPRGYGRQESYSPRSQRENEGYSRNYNRQSSRWNGGDNYASRPYGEHEGSYQWPQHGYGYQNRDYSRSYQPSDRYNQQGEYSPYPSRAPRGYGRTLESGNGRPRPKMGKKPSPRKSNGVYMTPPPREVVRYKEVDVDPTQPLRLNKFLANAGVCSRREADIHITSGDVMVNDVVVTELGTKVQRDDVVKYKGKVVALEDKVYVLLNKPRDYVTTNDDPDNRKTVMDLVRTACPERIYPVGRLDRNTTGVLLLTNDGDLASRLMHPKFLKKKIYHVYLNKIVTEEDMQRMRDGIELEDGEIKADAVEYASETDHKQVGIEIHSGKNRIVRRIFESLGYKVNKLDRVYFAGLTKKNLRRGQWRYLTAEEVNMLRMGAFE